MRLSGDAGQLVGGRHAGAQTEGLGVTVDDGAGGRAERDADYERGPNISSSEAHARSSGRCPRCQARYTAFPK